jgi:signal transduction histidine kinase/ActR/RegA family two-component response regulator
MMAPVSIRSAATSLRFRLTALVLVAMIPGVVLLAEATSDQQARARKDLDDAAMRLVQLVAEQQQRTLESSRVLLTGLSRLPSLSAPAEHADCAALLGDMLRQLPVFHNVLVADPAGMVTCTGLAQKGFDIHDRLYFRAAVESRAFAVGERITSRTNGDPTVNFGVPIIDERGTLLGVVAAGLDLDVMATSLASLVLPDGALALVTDSHGSLLATSVPEMPITSAVLSSLGSATSVEVEDADGVLRLYASRLVPAPDGTIALRVAVGIPSRAARLLPARAVRRFLVFGLTALLALALALVGGELLVVRRLEALVTAARRLASGDLSARAGLSSKGEIGQLGAAFDDMARSLEALFSERRRLEDQLRQAQKMEAVGQLAGGVAHDFNNLLTVILSGARFVKEDLSAAHASQEDVDEILAAAERAASLTRQLLAFSRRQIVEPRSIDLGEIVIGFEKMLRRLIGEHIALETRVAPGAGRAFADPGQVQQVILNLAVNARDAMPGGGRLVIEVADASAADRGELDGHQGLPTGPLVRLSMIDSGVGMDEATAARIFEPFFTTKPVGKGTGLGLSTVYGIVAQSGGAIRVRSSPGEGAAFHVFFPRPASAPAEGQAAVAPSPAEQRGGGGSVLLVEDDAAVRAVARRALAYAGYEVQEAPLPGEAIALALARGTPFDLLVTDVILPEMNGADLAARLLEEGRVARVLYVSGYTGGQLAADALASGQAFLPKPFTPDVLVRRVREVLDAPAPRQVAA